MYDHSSVLIVSLLLLALVVAAEAGFRPGRIENRTADDSKKFQINSIQAFVLGVLALILAITVSLSL